MSDQRCEPERRTDIYLTDIDRALKRLRSITVSDEDIEKLHLHQMSLEAELQEVSDAFSLVVVKLQDWKTKTVARLQEKCEIICRRQTDDKEAKRLENDVRAVCSSGDIKGLKSMFASMDTWLADASQRSSEFTWPHFKYHIKQGSVIKLRSVGDVATRVLQLQNLIAVHMASVMCSSRLEKARVHIANRVICHSLVSVKGLDNHPYHVTCCTDATGFVGDPDGRVIRAESDVDVRCRPLPQPSAFVSFGPNSANYLQVTSLTNGSAVKMRCHCQRVDWSKWILGLHCDIARRLLMVAQASTVTVTDLSGCHHHSITSSSLGTELFITDMACSSDKILTLDGPRRKILVTAIDSWQLETVISLNCFSVECLDGFVLFGAKKLLILDSENGRIYKLCRASGLLIDAFPAKGGEDFRHPWQAIADRCGDGVIFISERDGHRVQVLSSSTGVPMQTLDGVNQDETSSKGFKHPTGLSLVRCQELNGLVVCDWGRNSLRVYQLTAF